MAPYGQTSLYDAIAQTARRVADTRPGDPHRRAVVVFTDGVDTSSLLTPEQVSAIASEIDVPVYVMTVVSPSDHEDRGARGAAPESALRTLAQWTGGDLFVTSAPAHESVAARQIVDELRHQYVLAFARVAGRGLASAGREDQGSGSDRARPHGLCRGDARRQLAAECGTRTLTRRRLR